jgi:hypothetical protein
MTRPLPFTEASLQRAIRAARKAGLRVMGIRADGTLLVNDGDNLSDTVAPSHTDGDTTALSSKWGDVQA